MVRQPTVISTFAGCGGSSLGYRLAGFHELLAVEWDDNAVATFQLNFPEVPTYHGDIAKLSSKECMRLAGIESGELDVLDGSPPCQGFSTAGRRRFSDPRNSLFKEYARLLKELQPKAFVMENVTGMVKGHMKQAYLQIIKMLRGCGYRAKGAVMNAMYFNVPQSRERVIIIGARHDLGIEPSHPKPQMKPVTVREAISNLQNDGPLATASCGRALKRMPQGANNGGGKYLPHTYGLNRLAWDKPSPTLIKEPCRLAHPDGDRYLSIDAAKAIASFPKSFHFTGKYAEAWERIGNSVPPNLMRAIAEHIKTSILQGA